MNTPYVQLSRAIEAAGYVTAEMPLGSQYNRLVCASRQREDGSFSGSSFWVAFLAGKWFLGTWSTHVYRLPFDEKVQELCLAWLQMNSHNAQADVPERLKDRYCLLEADDAGLIDELH